ncbi:C45 family autoproteolytic acyltransferase/hydolase [Alistipes sp. ZOR0009]|uniref:C45 family autoproteolytic acyltransferase/hydolase n=1 Tax=Alistipes sp. ZOR0009 TaxID=1339253 RepID=UPI0006472B1F|nr:C45 family peptidase [Alistipes sp. ZOR0009]
MKSFLLILSFAVFNAFLASATTGGDSRKEVVLDTAYSSLPVLHLNGTPYENGFQHGKIMRSRIAELVGLWKRDIEEKYGIPADRFIATFLDSTNYIPSIKRWTPDLLEEIRGISAGSGIDFNTIFAFQLVDEIWTNARLISIPHHCTSIGVNNSKRDGSPNYIAQNIDITPFYHGFEVLLDIVDTETGARKLVTTFAGYIGANGVNRHIGITENTLADLKSSLDGLPVCCVARGVLEKESFEEAVDFIRGVKHASGQNYIVGSDSSVISLECASDLVTEYWPDSTKEYTFHANKPLTNSSYHPAFLSYLKALYGSIPESVSFSDERLEAIKAVALNSRHISLEVITDALSKRPICNANTFVSTIMEFGKGYSELRISPGKPDSTEYILFRIKK